MSVHQLVYTSRAIKEFDTERLRKLLQQARRHNHSQQISGLLLYSEGFFLQVLEGSAAAVQSLYHERIAYDRRHGYLQLLADGAAPRRLFAGWAMGFLAELPVNLPGYLNPHAVEERFAAGQPGSLQALLCEFVADKMVCV